MCVLEASILCGPNWTFSFHISKYVFDMAIGAMLGEQEE